MWLKTQHILFGTDSICFRGAQSQSTECVSVQKLNAIYVWEESISESTAMIISVKKKNTYLWDTLFWS